jgi:Putative zinc-finger
MTLRCDDARKWITQALVRDLGDLEHQQLQAHLLDCPSCCKEQELCVDMFQQLASVSDVPVPRHFFVYPEDSHSRWLALRWLGWPQRWRVAAVTTGLAVALLIGLAMFRFRFRADDGVYSFSFGKPLPSQATPSLPSVDVTALKTELLRLLETRSERERLELMDTLRREFHEANRNLTRKQRRQWDTALATLDARLSDRLEDQSLGLKAGVDRSMRNLYQTLQLQRQQDLALTRDRLDRMTARGELKDKETEEILSTLLQVAQFQEK